MDHSIGYFMPTLDDLQQIHQNLKTAYSDREEFLRYDAVESYAGKTTKTTKEIRRVGKWYNRKTRVEFYTEEDVIADFKKVNDCKPSLCGLMYYPELGGGMAPVAIEDDIARMISWQIDMIESVIAYVYGSDREIPMLSITYLQHI